MRRASPALRWLLGLLLATAPAAWPAQNFDLRVPNSPADPDAANTLRDLAGRVLPVYEEPDHQRYLATLSALQLVAGDYPSATATRQELRNIRRDADPTYPVERSIAYDIYARAKSIEARDRQPFDAAFNQAYREVVPKLSDKDAYAIISQLETPPGVYQNALQNTLNQLRGHTAVDLPTALQLIWEYVAYDSSRGIGPLIGRLAAEDDERRYVVDPDVLIKTRDGATLTAVVVRPRQAAARLPSLLEFTIYVYPVNDAKECAAHGYVGVVAYARGKRASPDKVEPFAHDGEDARSVIGWISRQSWSDGHVGMYGAAYSGYTAWAATKQLPTALKTIVASTPTAPGIDAPKEGGIYHNSAYRWDLYVTDTTGRDAALYNDDQHWRELDERWYREGLSYWDLMDVYGRRLPDFLRWLSHPSYDDYWQQLIPYRRDFAHVGIPILTTTGYFDGAAAGALYYFSEHYRYRSHADQVLVIGPYDHGVLQHEPLPQLAGFSLDPVAQINLRELRYQWFDYVLKGAPRPALLADRVNFEVMGANEWQHASSLAAMSNMSLRMYLVPANADSGSLQRQPSAQQYTEQTVPMDDRSDAGDLPVWSIVRPQLAARDAVVFESEPLSQPMQVSGPLSGALDLLTNRMDLDITVALYEKLSSGDYVALFDPPYAFRASYAAERAHRHLLKAGMRQLLPFHAERVTARTLQSGSRLVLVLGINKRPDEQINYGGDTDVSDGTIEDGRTPMTIRWYGSSYVELPIHQ
jgi:putative CocE/NonD family hydrolase